MERKFLTGMDLAVLGVVLAAVLAVLALTAIPPRDGLYADIYVGDSRVKTIDLKKVTEPYTETVTAGGYTLTLAIASGQIEVMEADCPDRCCVACGTLKDPGRCAVCLPARVVIRLRTGQGNEVDAVL